MLGMKTDSPKRYCGISYCRYHFGTKDPSVSFFRLPGKDSPLRELWVQNLVSNPDVEIDVEKIHELCYLHFNRNDLMPDPDTGSRMSRLRDRAIPLPVLSPIEENVSDGPLKQDDGETWENVERVQSDDSGKNDSKPITVSDNQNMPSSEIGTNNCVNCSQYELKLRSARTRIEKAEVKIVKLQNQIAELKYLREKDRTIQALLGENTFQSPQMNKYSEDDEVCKLCGKSLNKLEAKYSHVCYGDREKIICPYCHIPFVSTQAFLIHLVKFHRKEVQKDSEKSLYESDMCSKRFGMSILLDCHRKSHEIEMIVAKDEPAQSDEQMVAWNEPVTIVEETHPNLMNGLTDVRLIERTEQISMATNFERKSQSHRVSHEMIAAKNEPAQLDEQTVAWNEPVTILEETHSILMDVLSHVSHNERTERIPLVPKLKLFKCGFCGESFETPSQLGKHIRNHEEEKAKVVRKFARNERVKKNAAKKSKSNSECPRCKQTFETKAELSRHMRSKRHYGSVRTFECYLCKRPFLNRKLLRSHFRNHSREHKCQICEEPLTLRELETHLCGKRRRIECEYCQEPFTATIKLLEHLDATHSGGKRFIRCGKCPQFFPMQFLNGFHQATHSDSSDLRARKLPNKEDEHVGAFLCEECGRGFKSKPNLAFHKKTHNEPEFDCPDCGKKFSHQNNLRRHSEMHKDNKYVCEICSKELGSKFKYMKHRQIHFRTEADRKFACTLCPLKFFRSDTLKKHQVVHVGVKKFHCRFCDQSYKYNGDLNKHLKTHMGDKIHECPKCPMRFQYPQELQKHSFDHYREEKETISDEE